MRILSYILKSYIPLSLHLSSLLRGSFYICIKQNPKTTFLSIISSLTWIHVTHLKPYFENIINDWCSSLTNPFTLKKSAHNLQTQTLRPKQKNLHPIVLNDANNVHVWFFPNNFMSPLMASYQNFASSWPKTFEIVVRSFGMLSILICLAIVTQFFHFDDFSCHSKLLLLSYVISFEFIYIILPLE